VAAAAQWGGSGGGVTGGSGDGARGRKMTCEGREVGNLLR
jgi:hypothetical protein